jgi:phosphate starvation-inducible protein PhoH and related proteins
LEGKARLQPAKAKEIKLVVPGSQEMVDLLGHRDELLKLIETQFDTDVAVRGNEITIKGRAGEADKVATLFRELLELVATGERITERHVDQTIELITGTETISPKHLAADTLLVHRGRTIRPQTAGQKRYVDAIRNHTATFAIGPAGTGKTYLAMAMAVQSLKQKTVSRIILTRPAVEAGEKLGYLPGTLFEKVDPYLRPLYDALFEMMDPEQYQQFMDRGTIEVAPLAYMRGRTLNDSFIILDEAQNTLPEQMKMFLTRLGFGSKVVVTGDVTQVDLPSGRQSGLLVVERILKDIGDLAFVHLGAKDVVRHKLVQRIVEAYRRYDENKKG